MSLISIIIFLFRVKVRIQCVPASTVANCKTSSLCHISHTYTNTHATTFTPIVRAILSFQFTVSWLSLVCGRKQDTWRQHAHCCQQRLLSKSQPRTLWVWFICYLLYTYFFFTLLLLLLPYPFKSLHWIFTWYLNSFCFSILKFSYCRSSLLYGMESVRTGGGIPPLFLPSFFNGAFFSLFLSDSRV